MVDDPDDPRPKLTWPMMALALLALLALDALGVRGIRRPGLIIPCSARLALHLPHVRGCDPKGGPAVLRPPGVDPPDAASGI